MFGEQDVDQELKTALSVSPSPEFEARVLRRVEADRPSPWAAHYGWFAAAASLVIALGAFYALNRPSVVVEQAPARQIVEQTPPRALPPSHETPLHKNPNAPPRVTIARAARRAPLSTEPEVIVPPNQMAAVRRLVRAINEGRLELPAQPPSEPMAPPASLAVAPVVVPPISLSPLGPVVGTAPPFNQKAK